MNTENQEQMEKTFRRYIEAFQHIPGGCFEKELSPELYSCSYEEKSLVYVFNIADWMLNPGGILHGGIVVSMMDSAMGALTTCLIDDKITSTISMNINFISPCLAGKKIYIGCKCHKCGRTVAYMSARAWQDNENAPKATAEAVYYTAGPKNNLL